MGKILTRGIVTNQIIYIYITFVVFVDFGTQMRCVAMEMGRDEWPSCSFLEAQRL